MEKDNKVRVVEAETVAQQPGAVYGTMVRDDMRIAIYSSLARVEEARIESIDGRSVTTESMDELKVQITKSSPSPSPAPSAA